MDFNKIKVFHTVADIGGVTAAMSSLKMNQSVISNYINQIENELGCQLFQRHFKGMKLTKKGEEFYVASKDILENYNLILNSLKNSQETVEGIIKISTSFGVSSSFWFLLKLKKIIKMYPDLKIVVIDYKDGEIDSTTADIFICPYSYGRADLIQEKINDFKFRLYASSGYIKKHGEPKQFEDLDNHFLISFPKELRNPFNDADSLLQMGRLSTNLRHIHLEVNSSIALVRLVEEGVGIASLVEEEAMSKNLIPLFKEQEEKTISSCLTYKRKNKNFTNIKKFVECFLHSENSDD